MAIRLVLPLPHEPKIPIVSGVWTLPSAMMPASVLA